MVAEDSRWTINPLTPDAYSTMRPAPALLWLTTAAVVAALTLRFAMRAIGVRDDLPFPTLVYSFTVPLVEPFYRYFPAPERFDYRALEAASLGAAGVVVVLALGVYALGLLIVSGRKSQVSKSDLRPET